MRFPFVASAAIIIAAALAACNGGQATNYVAPPPTGPPAAGPVTLTGVSTTQGAGTASGITGSLTYVGGTGTVNATSSGTNPTGTTAVAPVDRIRVAAVSATSATVYYVTISSTAGATLTGLPAVSLLLMTPAVGTFQEARFSAGTWTNVSGATSAANSAGTAVSFPQGATAITIPAGGSIFLAFYQGNFPQATPVGQIANNVLVDPGFESPATAPPIGSPITSTGWTVCSFMTVAPGVAPPARAIGTFTPEPLSATTPGPAAAIEAAGTTIAQGTGAPHPTQFTVLANSGTHAAVFGAVFSNRQYEDYRYNGLCQLVTVPNNPGMSMSLLANGNDSSTDINFEVMALNTSGQYLGTIYEDPNPITGTSPGETMYRAVTVPQSSLAPFVGQTIQLFVGLWIDDGSSSSGMGFSGYYFLDDLNLTGTP
jgi:hypothetical protein